MMEEKITLRDETVKGLSKVHGQSRIDNAQRIIGKYLSAPEKVIKRIVLFSLRIPVVCCQEMGLHLSNEDDEVAQLFLDELVYQYKKVHPYFKYGNYYTAETSAKKQLLKELGKNSYAYDIIIEILEKNQNCKEDKFKRILMYLNSRHSIFQRKGFRKLGFESSVLSSISRVSYAIATVFEEMYMDNSITLLSNF